MDTMNRRSFVALAAQSTQVRSANSKVVLALIGAGGRGSTLAGNLAKVENAEFKYVCEVNDQRGGEVIKKLDASRDCRYKRIVRQCNTRTSDAADRPAPCARDRVGGWHRPIVRRRCSPNTVPTTASTSLSKTGVHPGSCSCPLTAGDCDTLMLYAARKSSFGFPRFDTAGISPAGCEPVRPGTGTRSRRLLAVGWSGQARHRERRMGGVSRLRPGDRCELSSGCAGHRQRCPQDAAFPLPRSQYVC